ncbi:hypothetical protein AVEN_42754-1 [Araneus ventricosus]|uniref:Uncharacterized protein n=1 Tax=Araneus ventricosus TaxID=182803 RepID=A0A4Y2AEG2_ARAVE|nr:hypothetical protein AVEN_42754-1 [Araneus ventricosus]
MSLVNKAPCLAAAIDGILQLDIHDHATPRKWSCGTPHHSIFQPIHLGRSFTSHSAQTTKSSSTSHSDILLHILSPRPSKHELLSSPISSSERAPPSSMYLRHSHFNIYGPPFQMDFKRNWSFKFSTTPILIGFSLWRSVLARFDQICAVWSYCECPPSSSLQML